MYTFTATYLLITIIFIGVILFSIDSTEDDSYLLSLRFTGLTLAVLWPLTMILVIMANLWELYRSFLKKRIEAMSSLIIDDNGNIKGIESLSVKELKVMMRAFNVGVIQISNKDLSLLKKTLIDKTFEEEFLIVKKWNKK